MQQQTASVFATHWNIYQKIIVHNYMLHAEFAGQTALAFKKLDTAQPLKVLDLGCGDAHQIAEQLKLQPVDSYTGYDLSAVALQHAKRNLTSVGCTTHLIEAELQSFAAQEHRMFDVIYSSYAIHHLQDGQKQQLLRDCFKSLRGKGAVIVIDIIRGEDQAKEEYVEQYISGIENYWAQLTPDEKGLIYEHIRNYDFPSSIIQLSSWAMEAGFTVEQSPVLDQMHKMLVLHKQ